VALFTIFTPLYVAVFADALEMRFRPRHLWTALLSVAGAAVIVYAGWGSAGRLSGFLLVQASNLCFAAGQVCYRRLTPAIREWRDRDVFAWLYMGGTAAAALAMSWSPGPLDLRLGGGQILALAYLGLLASGLGFFLWNIGSLRVSIGTLAVMNNLKVPLAVIVSLVFFGERTDLPRLAIGGGAIFLALALNSRRT
jgi:drug/metabolite transporter (DMT)-like permease